MVEAHVRFWEMATHGMIYIIMENELQHVTTIYASIQEDT